MAPKGRPVDSAVSKPSAEAPAAAAAPLTPLEARLHAEPYVFEFFQAVRLLEQFQPDRKPVGHFNQPHLEVARFAAHPSTAFPPSDIQSLEFPPNAPPRMTVNFMGLTGPQGVLPLWYTLHIIERLREGDRTTRDFFDIFNHRAISLLYRAWQKYRFPIAYERGVQDEFTQFLMDLIGLGTRGLRGRQSVPDDSLVFYTGLLGQQPRSAAALESILADYFEVPVRVEQFLGSWYALDVEDQCCLADQPEESEQVGLGAVVGDAVWDPHGRVRIRIGPLPLARYLEFLPNGSAYQPLRALTRFFSNDEFDFDVQLVLQQEEVPPCELGAEGDPAPQLGWVTWMRSEPIGRDPQDTILPL